MGGTPKKTNRRTATETGLRQKAKLGWKRRSLGQVKGGAGFANDLAVLLKKYNVVAPFPRPRLRPKGNARVREARASLRHLFRVFRF